TVSAMKSRPPGGLRWMLTGASGGFVSMCHADGDATRLASSAAVQMGSPLSALPRPDGGDDGGKQLASATMRHGLGLPACPPDRLWLLAVNRVLKAALLFLATS